METKKDNILQNLYDSWLSYRNCNNKNNEVKLENSINNFILNGGGEEATDLQQEIQQAAMDSGDYSAMTRQAKQRLKKLKVNPIDLGYQGEWAGTECMKEEMDQDKLECSYAKWRYKDKDAVSDPVAKLLQDRRTVKFSFNM